MENARCRICRRKSDDDNLLLCDGCNQAFHLYCLRPPLRQVPAGDWFCVSCLRTIKPAPKSCRETREIAEKQKNNSKAKFTISTSGSNSQEESTSSSDESDTSSGLPAGQKSIRSFLRPNDSRRASTSIKRFSSTRSTQRPSTTSTSASCSNTHDHTCLVCNGASRELVYCSGCPSAFHMRCHDPPLRLPPRGVGWMCAICRVSRRKHDSTSTLPAASRKRTINRSSRRSSYLQLHRQSRDSGSESDGQGDGEEEEEEETTEAAASPGEEEPAGKRVNLRRNRSTRSSSSLVDGKPAKRLRIADDSSEEETLASAESICTDIVNSICRHKNAWPFKEPVDSDEVPDYHAIIVEPVDLSLIRTWLKEGRYSGSDGPERLAEDLGKMFYNAELYNSADSDIWSAGSRLEQFVRSLLRNLSTPVVYKRESLT